MHRMISLIWLFFAEITDISSQAPPLWQSNATPFTSAVDKKDLIESRHQQTVITGSHVCTNHLPVVFPARIEHILQQCGENTGSVVAMLRGKLSESEESYQIFSIPFPHILLSFCKFMTVCILFKLSSNSYSNFTTFPHFLTMSSLYLYIFLVIFFFVFTQ